MAYGNWNRVQQSDTYWVFGYGSLMWRPGFAHIRATRALMPAVHRRLCIISMRHRGTSAIPGLVFGLVPGGSCPGMGFEVEAGAWPEVSDYLRERERDNGVYVETRRPLKLDDGRSVIATVFMADRAHPQFAGRLTIEEQIARVCVASGESGPNADYVRQTYQQLRKLGIKDTQVEALIAAMGPGDGN